MKDNLKEAEEYLTRAIWLVNEEVEEGAVATLRTPDEHVDPKLWDIIFDAKKNGVKYTYYGRVPLSNYGIIATVNIHIFAFFKKDTHGELIDLEVKKVLKQQ